MTSEPVQSGAPKKRPRVAKGAAPSAPAAPVPAPAAAAPETVERPATLRELLERRLQDAGKVDHRLHWLNGRAFVQGPASLSAVTREGDLYQLLPGHLDVTCVAQLRDLDANRVPDDVLTDTVFTVRFRPPSGPELTAPVSSSDLDAREPSWPDALGVRARTAKRSLETVASAVRALGQSLERGAEGWTDGYACAGPLRRPDGSYAWLRHGRPALTAEGTDPALSVAYPEGVGAVAGVRVLDVDDPSDDATAAGDFDALLRVLDLTPQQREVSWALLAQLAWAPMSAIPDLGRVAVLLAGETGSRKTAMVGAAVIAAQSSTYAGGEGVEVPVTVKARHNQSTIFGVDQLLHPLSGMVAVVDDWFAGRMTPKEISEAWRRLSAIGDNAATGAGGVRGGYRNGRGVIAKGHFPRSCVLATAERLPDEAKHSSETARYVALEMRHGPDLDVLSEVQRDPRRLSRAHAGMIRAALADVPALYEALEWGKATANGWQLGGHGRVVYGYARLLAGAWLLARRAEELDVAGRSALLEDATAALYAAASEQTRRSGMRNGRDLARDPVRLFVRRFREALGKGEFWAAAPARVEVGDAEGAYTAPTIPGHGAHALGWRQALTGVLAPAGAGDPIGAVVVHAATTGRPPWRPVVLRMRGTRWSDVYEHVAARVLSEDGWTLPAPAELAVRLVQAGYLAPAVASLPLWADAGYVRCRDWDLAQLLDADDEDTPEAGPPTSSEPTDAGGPGTPDAGTPGEPGNRQGALLDVDDVDEGPGAGAVLLCIGCRQVMTDDLCDGYHPGCVPESTPAGDPESGPVRPADALDASTPAATRGAADDGAQGATGPQGGEGRGGSASAGGRSDSHRSATRPERTERVKHNEPAGELGKGTSGRHDVQTSRRPDAGAGVGRREYAAQAAVLDLDGLHLPGAPVVPAELPATKSAAYALASEHNVKQLWLTPRAAAALALPDVEDPARQGKPVDAGTPHAWADDHEVRSDPAGVAPWMVVWGRTRNRREDSRSIVLPHLDTRAPWGRHDDGQARDVDGSTLLAAVSALREALGGDDYYWSPNATWKAIARRRCERLTPSLALQAGEVAPAAQHRQALPAKWVRARADLTDRERELLADDGAVVVRLDRNAAYLSAMSTALGVGEPTWHPEGRPFAPDVAGYWRVREAPPAPHPLLPALAPHRDRDGALWLVTPYVALLAELGHAPEITGAWTWEKSSRVLNNLYERIRKARVQTHKIKSTPHGEIAHKVIGALYKTTTGELASTSGPNNADDAFWRPDHRDHLKGEAGSRMMRNLLKAGPDGAYPIATYIDAAYFLVPNVEALPGHLTYDDLRGGAWKPEGAVPVARLRTAIGDRKFHERFDRELERLERGEQR